MMTSRRVLPLVVLLASFGGIVAAQQPAAPAAAAAQRTPQEVRDMQAVLQLTEAVAAGRQAAPADVPVTWQANHFLAAGDGSTYMPFTVNVDASKIPGGQAVLYVRAMTKEQVAAAATPAPAPAAAPQGN